MWAIRRTSNTIRQSQRIVIARTCFSTLEILRGQKEHGEADERDRHVVGGCILPRTFTRVPFVPARSFFWTRNLSSQAGAESSASEALEEGFSDLEGPPEADEIEDVNNKDEEAKVDVGISEEESNEADVEDETDVDASLEPLDDETDVDADGKTPIGRRSTTSQLFKSLAESRQPVSVILNKWVEEGKPLGRNEIAHVMHNLRRRKFYKRALQLMEWLEENKRVDLIERDYVSHLDLIVKVHGLQKVVNLIDKIPESLMDEVAYRPFLSYFVSEGNVGKAEEFFNGIRDSGFPTTIFACNQLLLLYKHTDHKKIGDVLKLMEQKDIQPSLLTYKILIDIKGHAEDIVGMEEILETMKAKGMEPDLLIQGAVARHYILGCHKAKAEAILKEMEGEDIMENRAAFRFLLPLYAALGKADNVERIWKACEANPHLEEYLAGIEAMGELGEVDNAEKVFGQMVKTCKKLPSEYYNVLLEVYAKHKLLDKGVELLKKMLDDDGCIVGPLTLDAIVKLCVESMEVDKVDSFLEKAVQQNLQPLYSSYMAVLEKYAERGDIHNAEKIFLKLRQNEYVGRIRLYQALLQAYANANAPAYGLRERMEADNMFPKKALATQLAAVHAFKKTPKSMLLDWWRRISSHSD